MMDRDGYLRSVWMVPSTTALLVALLCWGIWQRWGSQGGPVESPLLHSSEVPPNELLPVPAPATCPRAVESDHWLLPLSEASRTVLTAFTEPSGETQREEPIPPRLLAVSRAGEPLLRAPDGRDFADPRTSLPWDGAAEPTTGRSSNQDALPRSLGPLAVAEEMDDGLGSRAESPTRSEILERTAREADACTRRAFALAGRGAYFSARAEFIAALRLLAQGLDGERRTNLYSRKLADALTALKEGDDFVPKGSQLEANLDLDNTVACHQTPVLKSADLSKLTPIVALQCYLTYAQEQFAASAGGELAGSMALRGLGKLHETMAEKSVSGIEAARAKAIAYYQAALLTSPENYLASNDLGVMLARNGRFDDARVALEHSLRISQQPACWHNLAAVYRQLRDPRSAERAENRAREMERMVAGGLSRQPDKLPAVDWLDPQTFARTTLENPGPTAYAPPPRTVPDRATSQTTAIEAHISRSPFGNPPDKRK